MAASIVAPSLRILGPLQVWRDGVEIDPGPRQQALLLAVLLARTGQPVSVGELIEVIWPRDEPSSAVNIIQKHVGALRRLLEPDLLNRDSGSYLRLHGNGYLLAADADVVDLVAFRDLTDAARAALARQDREESLERYAAALGLWRGPAGDTLNDGSSVKHVFTALDDEFFTACVAAAEISVSLGRPQRVLRQLRLAASMAPLHEPVQAALVSALSAAGNQAEAQLLFDTVRARLADELGIDPGPALQAAHRRALGGAFVSTATVTKVPARTPRAGAIVGRTEELAVLRHGVDRAFAGGTGLVLVEGEPGVGKTRLLEEMTAEAEQRGALVVWGQCLEGDGTPAMWPWVQAVGALLGRLPAGARNDWLAGELGRLVTGNDAALDAPVQPDSGTQFRLFERVAGIVADAASRGRLMLVLDDLQWADRASLDLFGHLGGQLPAGVALIGAFRTHAPVPGSELTRMLAGVSRVAGHRRIHLGPLDQDEVTELVHLVTGRMPTPVASHDIRARTGGNPFFVRELSRLLTAGDSSEGEDAVRTGLPSTVRDVVQDRMADLDHATRRLLQIAALIGREVDVGLLARVAGLEVQACMRGLEPVEELGLIGPMPGNPFSVRFAHDLVRESVVRTTPPRHAPAIHLRVADAIGNNQPFGEPVAERLAHHLSEAGPLADPSRTATALVRAGRSAAVKFAFDAAERHLRMAVRVARSAGLAEDELAALSQLTMVLGMQAGYLGAPPDILERSEELARGLGRELEATSLLFTRWTGYSQGIQIQASGQLAGRLRERGEASTNAVVRGYGWLAWGVHQWEIGDIGEALRYVRMSTHATSDGSVRLEHAPLLRDLKLLSAGMLGLMTTLHGDVPEARSLFAEMEADAGDDPYAVTFWATFVSLSATLAGEPEWALTAAERGIAADPDLKFEFLGTYQRLARCWALALLGRDPDSAAAEIERRITRSLLDPPRSCIVTWYGALAEMRMAAGALDEAEEALDRAEWALNRYGQRYAEGLILLLRTRLLAARGRPADVIRAAAERTQALSLQREALLFGRRAEHETGSRGLSSRLTHEGRGS